MKENWHNKELKKGLGGFESPMDMESAWDALEARRNPKRKKRPVFFFFLFGLLSAGIVGGYVMWKSDVNAGLISSEINTKVLEIENGSTSALEKEERFDEERDLMPEVPLVEKKSEVVALNNSNLTEFLLTDKAEEVTFDNNISTNTVTGVDVLTNTTNKLTAINKSKKEINHLLQNNSPSIIANNQPLADRTNEEEANLTEITIVSKSDVSVEHKIQKNTNGTYLPSLSFQGINLSEPNVKTKKLIALLGLDNNAVTSPTPPMAYSKKLNYLGFSTSYALLPSGHVDESEKPLDAFSIAGFYERKISKRFYWRAALSYQQFTTKVKLQEIQNYTEMEAGVVIAVNRLQNGMEEEVLGTAEVKYSETTHQEVYNRYRFLEVPIWLGYRYPLGQKSALRFEAGLSTSILARHSGKAKLEGLLVSFEDLPNYKTKEFGFLRGLYGVQYEMGLGGNRSLFIGSFGGVSLNEILEFEGMDGQRFVDYGVVIGGRFGF